jgi:hypothetical protein
MATTTVALARTAAAVTNTTLYTVPTTTTTTVVTNIVTTNTAGTAATFTINIDGVAVLSGVSLAANSSAFFDLKQVIPANATPKTISGSASATTVNFHISGVEIA